ncbi:hypothetical protein Tco_1028629, partial [Tanacetum coccineum]
KTVGILARPEPYTWQSKQYHFDVMCPVRLWFHWISFDYRVTLGFSSIAGGLDHVNPVIRLPIEHGISRVLGSTENAIKHIEKVLEVASLFNTNDSALLRVFPLTLVWIAKRWFDRTSPEHAKKWDELKQIFIRGFCPPAIIFKQLGEIRNFKQEDGESLFYTWERYNDLLFKCPFHDLNDHQKVNSFYNGLKGHTRRIVDSNGLIPGLTASEALKSIQELAYHSHKWHNKESEKNTLTSFGIITDKLKALNHEMDKLRVDVRKINTNGEKKSLHEEIKSIRTSEISYDKSCPKSNIHPTNLKDTFEHYLKESYKR